MNKKDFMKAMSMIDDDLIRDADAAPTAEAPEYEETVSGVERYRRPVWQTVTTLAASLLLVIGVGAGGTYYLTHRGAPAPEEEKIIAASTAESAPTESETEGAEFTTMATRKRDTLAKTTLKGTETKESTDKEPVTAPSEDGEVKADNDGEERETDAPVTKAATPVTTAAAQTTAVQTTAIPVWTQFPQTTAAHEDPNWYPGIDYGDYDIFSDLANNSYYTPTCDGIPEFRLYAPDGTLYQINLSEQWVWRRGANDNEYAESMLTPSQWDYLTKLYKDILADFSR